MEIQNKNENRHKILPLEIKAIPTEINTSANIVLICDRLNVLYQMVKSSESLFLKKRANVKSNNGYGVVLKYSNQNVFEKKKE